MSNSTLFFIFMMISTALMGYRVYKEDLYNTIYYAALTIVIAIIWAVYMIKESL